MNHVTVEDKRKLIKWLLRNVKLKSREAVWFLEYLSNDNSLLNNVVFTDGIEKQNRAALISATDSDNFAFKFYKNKVRTNSVEKAFHDVRMNKNESLYVKIDFQGKFQTPEYVLVHEEHNSERVLSPEVLEEAEAAIGHSEKQFLLKEIDKALDKSDQMMFMELWERLNCQKEAMT